MLRFRLTIKNGIHLNKAQFNEYMSKLEEGEYSLEVKKVKNPRSLMQNRYYFGCCVKTLAVHFQITPETMHDTLRYLFLREEIYSPILETTIEKIKSTTDLNTKEFEDYLERIRKWALEEYNVLIALPNEEDYYE